MKNLPNISLEHKVHRKSSQILIKFDFNNFLIKTVKKINGTKWSYDLKSWYIKDSKENLTLIFNSFKDVAKIDTSKLYKKNVFKRKLNPEEKKLLNNFYLYLKGKRYSKSTLQAYTFFIADFINFHTKKPLEELTNRDVELFIEKVFVERNYSISSQRQFISALKLFIIFYQSKLIPLLFIAWVIVIETVGK